MSTSPYTWLKRWATLRVKMCIRDRALTGEHAGESAPPPAAEPAEAGPAGEAAGQSDATDWSALLGMLGGGGDSNPLSALSELDPQLLQALSLIHI